MGIYLLRKLKVGGLFIKKNERGPYCLFRLEPHRTLGKKNRFNLFGTSSLWSNIKISLQVGVLIEEPFAMLALDELCKQVHRNIQEAMANEKRIQVQVNMKRKRHFKHSSNGWPSFSEDRELGWRGFSSIFCWIYIVVNISSPSSMYICQILVLS